MPIVKCHMQLEQPVRVHVCLGHNHTTQLLQPLQGCLPVLVCENKWWAAGALTLQQVGVLAEAFRAAAPSGVLPISQAAELVLRVADDTTTGGLPPAWKVRALSKACCG